jgi:D-aspartate ligase
MRIRGFDIPAVVVGGGIYALAAIRALGRKGVPVYYIDNWKNGAMYSSYCKKSFIAPSISESKNLLKSALLKLRSLASGAVLFPASDSMAMHMSNLRDELVNYILTVPKKEILETLINKRRFYESLTKQNVPHPITFYIEDYETVMKIAKRITYPTYIRPSFSQQFSKIFQRKGFVAKSAEELLRYFKLTKNAKMEVMIQEIIPGPPTSHIFVDGYMDSGTNPKVFFARQRLRMWPLTFGNSTLCKSISIEQVISQKEMLSRYLRSVNYSGIFSAEFKKDERDGTFKMLEINSRTSAWFSALSAKCGVNIMLIAYLNAIGKDTEYTEKYEAGFKWLDLENDIKAVVSLMSNGELTIPTWLSILLQPHQECFPFAKDDLDPFIVSSKHILISLKKEFDKFIS